MFPVFSVMISVREVLTAMTDKFRKSAALLLASFMIFTQAACGSSSAAKPAGDTAQETAADAVASGTATAYTYTNAEQLSADLTEMNSKALDGLSAKKDAIIGTFGSTLEDYQAAYPNVLEWYAEENKVTEELCTSYESILRDVYHSLSDSVTKGNENWPDDLEIVNNTFEDAYDVYQEKVYDLYSEIIVAAHDAQDSLSMNKVITSDQWSELYDTSNDDYDAAQISSWKSLDRLYGIIYVSYEEIGTALDSKNTDIDGIMDQIRERVVADVEETYSESEPEETASSDTGTESPAASSEPLDFNPGELNPELLLYDIAGDFTCALSLVSETDGSKRVVPEEESYEEIYNKYEAQVKETAKTALEEFQSESAGMTDSKEIFDLAKEKITKPAEVTKEGNIRLGMFSFTKDIKNGDHLNSFMEWSVKLQDVYIEEAYRITEAFEEKTGL